MNESAAWKLLVVDDEEDVHQVTKLVLGDFVFEDGRGLGIPRGTVLAASGSRAALIGRPLADARASLPRMGQGAGHSWLDDVEASLDVDSRDFPDSGW